MKCDRCGAWTEVAETRRVDGGHTLRRTRVCANMHRFQTFEVIAPIYRGDRRRVLAALNAAADRLKLWARYVALSKLAAEHGPSQAAKLGNTSRATVQRAIRAVKPKPPAHQTSDSPGRDDPQ